MTDKLLPCPFCGNADITITKPYEYREFIMCNNCGAMADSIDTEPERTPTEVWNMRAVREPLTPEKIMELHQKSHVDSTYPEYTTDTWGDEKVEYVPTKYFNMFLFTRAIEAEHGIKKG